MKRFLFLLLLAAGLVVAAWARAQDGPSVWQDATGAWEGGATAPVWKLAVWPGRDEVVASTASNGLWSTTDGGATWKRMGEKGKAPPNAGQAVQFAFDPKDPLIMWTSGMYKYGVWTTGDGGKTFIHLGKNDHADGIAVDFSDPRRKTLLLGLHEQEHSLHKSTDGGATWVKIGDKIPEGTAFTTDPIILDAQTYLINSSGYKKGETWGIYRTEDGGETWTKVSDEGAAGNATVTTKGDIYWPVLWDQHIIKSSDRGKTWTRVEGPARGTVIEVRPDRLIALGGTNNTQLYVSKDDGETWTAFGPIVPFKTRGLIYNAARNSIFVWAQHDKGGPRQPRDVLRWDLPKDLETVFTPK